MTRDEVIELIEDTISERNYWDNNSNKLNRHLKIGELWASLKAGCDYFIDQKNNIIHVIVMYDKLGHDIKVSYMLPTREKLYGYKK